MICLLGLAVTAVEAAAAAAAAAVAEGCEVRIFWLELCTRIGIGVAAAAGLAGVDTGAGAALLLGVGCIALEVMLGRAGVLAAVVLAGADEAVDAGKLLVLAGGMSNFWICSM